MSIERQYGRVTLICDECEEPLGESFPEFPTMLAHAKGAGWEIKPDGDGGWTHKCPDCAGDTPGGLSAQKKLFGR